MVAAVVAMVPPAVPAVAQPLECEGAAAAEPGMVRTTCIHVTGFGYMLGLIEGFADACGAEEKAIFTECAERFLDRALAPGAATPATAELIRGRYADGYANGRVGQDIPAEVSCDAIPLLVTDSDIGRLCRAEEPAQ